LSFKADFLDLCNNKGQVVQDYETGINESSILYIYIQRVNMMNLIELKRGMIFVDN